MLLSAAARSCATRPDAGRDAIRELLSGNYCRCTGYQAIVDAIEAVLRSPTQPASSPILGGLRHEASRRMNARVLISPTRRRGQTARQANADAGTGRRAPFIGQSAAAHRGTPAAAGARHLPRRRAAAAGRARGVRAQPARPRPDRRPVAAGRAGAPRRDRGRRRPHAGRLVHALGRRARPPEGHQVGRAARDRDRPRLLAGRGGGGDRRARPGTRPRTPSTTSWSTGSRCPPVVDMHAAREGARVIHPQLGDNVCFHRELVTEGFDEAFAKAPTSWSSGPTASRATPA
jgi:hypothetical protein